MTRKTLTAVALIAAMAAPLAGAATAQNYNAGATQLAESLGVAPGVYSLSQLTVLSSLQSDDTANQAQIAYILANPQGSDAQVTRSAATLPSDLGSLAD